jgi:hypothetical protein
MAAPILAAANDKTANGCRVVVLDRRPVQTDGLGRVPIGFGNVPEGPLLKSKHVAERLGVSQRWVTDKWRAGHLTGYQLPGSNRLRFDWSEVVACLEKKGGE